MDAKSLVLIFFNAGFYYLITLFSCVDSMFFDIYVNYSASAGNHDEVTYLFYVSEWNRRDYGVVKYFSYTFALRLSLFRTNLIMLSIDIRRDFKFTVNLA